MDIITPQPKSPLNPTTDPLQNSNQSDQTNPLNSTLSNLGNYQDIANNSIQNSHFLLKKPTVQFFLPDGGTSSLFPNDPFENGFYGPEPEPNLSGGVSSSTPASPNADPLTGTDSGLLTGSDPDNLTGGWPEGRRAEDINSASPGPDNLTVGAFPDSLLNSPLFQSPASSSQVLILKQPLLLIPLADQTQENLSPMTFGGTLASGIGRAVTPGLPETAGGLRGVGQILNQQHLKLLTNRRVQDELLSGLLTTPGRDTSRLYQFKIFGPNGGPIMANGPFNNPILREGEELVQAFTDSIHSSGKLLKGLNALDVGLTGVSGGFAFSEEYVNSNGDFLSSGSVAFVNAAPPAAIPQLISLGIDIPFSMIDPDLPAPSVFDGTVGNGARFLSAGVKSLVTLDTQPIETVVNRVQSGGTGGFANIIADAGSAFGESFLTPIFSGDVNDFELNPIQTFAQDLENGEYGLFGQAVAYTTPQGLILTSLFGEHGLFGK